MGVVYLALQDSTNQLVALKCLRPGISTERMVQRFEQEVSVLGKLDHPGIAKVFDAGALDAMAVNCTTSPWSLFAAASAG
ncbi:MAG: serine/threonine protein kinase [Candidatus Paceibacteria bacterium]|jgi:serine/threonine protein kinase